MNPTVGADFCLSRGERVQPPSPWTRCPPRWVIAATLLLGSASAPTSAQWDPPAIRWFPDHEVVAANVDLVPLLVEQGRELFETRFNEIDGAGRPGATGDSKPTPRPTQNDAGLIRTSGPDASACSSCHNQPASGGSGDFVANAFVGAHFADPPSLTIELESTSERNTTSLFGSGLIEAVAAEMTTELQAARDGALSEAERRGVEVRIDVVAKGVAFGFLVARPDGTLGADRLEGVDYDLVVRPFGVKGIAASLREFTIAALNQHHGMQAIERFGWEKTGRRDFDLDGVEEEISIGQLTALVIFQATLPPPERRVSVARSPEAAGQALFHQIGCASCHIPALPLTARSHREPNRYNRPGAVRPRDATVIETQLIFGQVDAGVVAAYTDLKRHDLCDSEVHHFCNEHRKQDNVATGLFLTAKLWDLALSAPYGHRGDLRTVSAAILAHGGEARSQRRAFMELTEDDKRAVVAFLLSLGGAATEVP